MPQLQQAVNTAKTPVYGEAQKAGYLGGLDELANSSIKNLQANMARRGMSNSGATAEGITDINLDRNAQAGKFFSQIPFLNRQATDAALPGLFGQMNNLTAVAPRTQSMNQTSTSQGNSSGTSNQTQKQGGSWLDTLTGIMGLASSFMGMPFMNQGVKTGTPNDQIPGGVPGGVNQYMNPWPTPQPMLPPPPV